MGRSRRRWLPVALVASVVLGVATSVGAQVDPSPPGGAAVWSVSCVNPGSADLVAYGRGWSTGPVAIEVRDETGSLLGVGAATPSEAAGGAGQFQTRLQVGAPAEATLRLVATQPGRSAEHTITVGSCSPTIIAVATGSCALAGRPVLVTLTVRGAPPSAFDVVVHHVDLYGPAEAVDRSQPNRPNGDYSFPITVPNAPDRVVPVTVEARRTSGGFAYATAMVGLPPACSQPNSTTAPSSPTTVPGTTQPPGATTTAAPASPGPLVTLPPSRFPLPVPATGPSALVLRPTIGRTGEATTVTGSGFAPSSTLTLRWRPGIGEWRVRAGGDGSFRTQVLVLPNDVEGRRVLEVVEGGTTSAVYLVVPSSDQPAFNGVFVRS